MVRIFYHNENEIKKTDDTGLLQYIPKVELLWVDLQLPTEKEQQQIEFYFNINFIEQQEEADLESNSRFYETDQFIYINSNFTSKRENYFENSSVIFYFLDEIVVSKRTIELPAFAETVRKIKRNQNAFKHGNEILETIFETQVDLDLDYMEAISKEIVQVGKNLSKYTTSEEETILLKINEHLENTLFLREGFVDKQRVLSSLLKSNRFVNTMRLKILIKDISSNLEFSSFIFKRLEYLQNTLTGLINIEQNKTIKIFTIVSVVFMPPTLIASIYGMNFKVMPELSWSFGYPFGITLIIGSSLLTLFIFKRKKWL